MFQFYTTHTKKVIARLYFFILRNKLTEKQQQVRNFAWHQDHIFRLRLHSCSKVFETGPGFEIFLNLRIRILFSLR